MTTTGFPRPVVTADVAFLHEGFAHGEWRVQTCGHCGRHRHPPSPACPVCHSLDWHATPVGLRGVVHSYTVHHHPPIPPFATPHVVVLADMDDGLRFVAALRGVAPDGVRIGMPVEIRFEDVEPGYRLPVFHACNGARA